MELFHLRMVGRNAENSRQWLVFSTFDQSEHVQSPIYIIKTNANMLEGLWLLLQIIKPITFPDAPVVRDNNFRPVLDPEISVLWVFCLSKKWNDIKTIIKIGTQRAHALDTSFALANTIVISSCLEKKNERHAYELMTTMWDITGIPHNKHVFKNILAVSTFYFGHFCHHHFQKKARLCVSNFGRLLNGRKDNFIGNHHRDNQ